MRSFHTVQAVQPVADATAQVLHEWAQQSQHRQHAASNQGPAPHILPQPAARRRRRQNLNIVSSKPSTSQQAYSAGTRTAGTQQRAEPQSMNARNPSNQQGMRNTRPAAKQAAGTKGMPLRSLATADMLLSHAQLLQQLQQSKTQPLQFTAASHQAFDAEQAQKAAGRVQPLSPGQSQFPAQQPMTARLRTAQQANPAEQDTMSIALDLVENQLPDWSHKQPLDWSAQLDISVYQPQV